MRARAVDAPHLAALHGLCFDKGWPEADFAHHISRDLTYTDPDHASLLVIRDGGGQAEILTLCTHPNARGRGLARTLLAEALPHITARALFLEVAEDNAPAIGLYRSLGFIPFGRRPAYYRRDDGRVAALLMEKRLHD